MFLNDEVIDWLYMASCVALPLLYMPSMYFSSMFLIGMGIATLIKMFFPSHRLVILRWIRCLIDYGGVMVSLSLLYKRIKIWTTIYQRSK